MSIGRIVEKYFVLSMKKSFALTTLEAALSSLIFTKDFIRNIITFRHMEKWNIIPVRKIGAKVGYARKNIILLTCFTSFLTVIVQKKKYSKRYTCEAGIDHNDTNV